MAKKTKKKTTRRRAVAPKRVRPNRLDVVVSATIQDSVDLATVDLIRRRQVLSCEEVTTDQEIIDLSARLSDARTRRARVGAQLQGIGAVLLAR